MNIGNLIANHSYKLTMVDLNSLINSIREHLLDNIQATALLGRVCRTVFSDRCAARTLDIVHGYLLEEFLRDCLIALHNDKRLEAAYAVNKAVDTALHRAYSATEREFFAVSTSSVYVVDNSR